MQSPSLDIVAFGEAMAMFIADDYSPLEMAEYYTRGLAGAEINVTTGLARLGYRVGWLSRLGVDPLGRFILNEVRRSDIDTTRVLFDDVHPTGFQLKHRVQVGDPQVIYFRRGSAASSLAPNAEDDAYIRSARHLHVTGIPPALSESCRRYTYHAIEQARETGMSVSFDPNLRPVLWKSVDEMRTVLNDIARRVDWIFPGLSEATLLTGYTTPEEVAQFYLDLGVKKVVVKVGRGAHASLLLQSATIYPRLSYRSWIRWVSVTASPWASSVACRRGSLRCNVWSGATPSARSPLWRQAIRRVCR